MKWNNVKPDISIVPLEGLVQGWSAFDVLKLLSLTKTSPLIIMDDSVRNKIYQHLSSKKVELGGLLLGNVISSVDLNSCIVVIRIVDAFASSDFDSTSVSLSMNPNIWQRANEYSDNNTFVVGWYHSHPNLSAFFSGIDRKTQKDFFNNEYSLGLVVDPIRNEECWFRGADSVEVSPDFIKGGFGGMALV